MLSPELAELDLVAVLDDAVLFPFGPVEFRYVCARRGHARVGVVGPAAPPMRNGAQGGK